MDDIRSERTSWAPRSDATTNLFLAGVIWVAVGCGLAMAGTRWLFEDFGLGLGFALGVVLGSLLGALKFRFVLTKTAHRVRDRINARGDGKCVGGMFSWGTWGFIGGMMLLGNILRRLSLPLYLLGAVYLAVGVALAAGSSIYFGAWRDRRGS
ncbi:MAG: hypothetical protein KC609_00830 [Myxococcales bacterium]|nr:hypothetical protein [Myxococcales bacterium]